MAFPTTPVLDGGTSPVENPITTNEWLGPIFAGQQPLQRTATGIARGSATGGSYINTIYGPDSEAYATINVLTAGTGAAEGFLYVRAQNVNTTSLDGYIVRVRANASVGTDDIRISVETDGVDTPLGTTVIGTFAVGDKYGISAVGDQITGWFCPVSTGIWAPVVGPFTNGVYASAGNLGIEMIRSDTRLTNFGGGALVKPFDVSDFPKVIMRDRYAISG